MLRGLLFTATCVGCIGTTATANATQVDRPVTVEVEDQNDVPIAVAAIRLTRRRPASSRQPCHRALGWGGCLPKGWVAKTV